MKKPGIVTGNITETLPSSEKLNVEKLKKKQADFNAVRNLKVFLKNTKGNIKLQKDTLGDLFRSAKKKSKKQK